MVKTQIRNQNLLKQIGLRLKEIRVQHQLTQEQVYNEIDVHVGRIEIGKTNLTISTLDKILDFYQMDFVEFFSGVSAFERKPTK